ncbi:MAG: zinc-ribbon domain-containing protein [Clostridiales bacterium]|nr:zinc-ribbon domain-containing protein [Clostridiales bacterium]
MKKRRLKCGKEIEVNAVFCHWCGAQQKEDSESGTASVSEKKDLNVLCVLGLVISGVSLMLNFWGLVHMGPLFP